MKKFLAILMTVAMMVSCMVGFALTSSAAPEWVYESYKFEDVMDDFGTQAVAEDGSLEEELLLGEYWTYEYYDVAEEEFSGMSAYFAESLEAEGWLMGAWSDLYMPGVESAWTGNGDPTWYCAIAEGGKRFHPGTGANPVVTFTAPATGVISYSASVYPYNNYGTAEGAPETETLYAAVYVNDELVWPEDVDDGRFTGLTASSDSPFMIDVTAFNVTEGDQVRLMLGLAPGNVNFGGAGMYLVDYPVVTYNEAEVSIGDPNGTPPEGISTSDRTAEGCTVSWSEARNAKGYNIYIDGEKVNSELVTELTYTITGLDPSSTYEVTITTVTNDGKESPASESVPFRTAKGEKKTDTSSSDTATGDTSAPAGTDAPAATTDGKGGSDISVLWIVIAIAAAVVVIAVVVVLVLVLGKKKAAPAAVAAPEAAAPAVEAAPEAAAPAEEAPAEEEKKED